MQPSSTACRGTYVYASDAYRVVVGLPPLHSPSSTSILNLPPQFSSEGFSPQLSSITSWGSTIRLLIVGAGGIGCELLPLLLMSGCGLRASTSTASPPSITIIDGDEVAVSNLNRQFCFRREDVGKWKSERVADYTSLRLEGKGGGGGEMLESEDHAVSVVATASSPSLITAVVGRVEDQPLSFFQSFDTIFLAVDSVETRQFMSRMVCQIAQWEVVPCTDSERKKKKKKNGMSDEEVEVEDGDDDSLRYRIQFAPPLFDAGSEGFHAHHRIVDLNYDEKRGESRTPCIDCTQYLFGGEGDGEGGGGGLRAAVPLCTLHTIPRLPEHCVWYAREVLWEEDFPPPPTPPCSSTTTTSPSSVIFDVENVDHIAYLHQKALQRQLEHQLGPPRFPLLTPQSVYSLLARPSPSVSFTNAFLAGTVVVDWMKWILGVAPICGDGGGYTYFNGEALTGIHHVVEPHLVVEEAERCVYCRPLKVVTIGVEEAKEEGEERRRTIENQLLAAVPGWGSSSASSSTDVNNNNNIIIRSQLRLLCNAASREDCRPSALLFPDNNYRSNEEAAAPDDEDDGEHGRREKKAWRLADRLNDVLGIVSYDEEKLRALWQQYRWFVEGEEEEEEGAGRSSVALQRVYLRLV